MIFNVNSCGLTRSYSIFIKYPGHKTYFHQVSGRDFRVLQLDHWSWFAEHKFLFGEFRSLRSLSFAEPPPKSVLEP